jgi:hypothetical protein
MKFREIVGHKDRNGAWETPPQLTNAEHVSNLKNLYRTRHGRIVKLVVRKDIEQVNKRLILEAHGQKLFDDLKTGSISVKLRYEPYRFSVSEHAASVWQVIPIGGYDTDIDEAISILGRYGLVLVCADEYDAEEPDEEIQDLKRPRKGLGDK